MKTIFFAIFILFATAYANGQQSGWSWQSPNFCADLLADIKVVSPTTAYVVGNGGTFIRTTDTGLTWSNPLNDSSYCGLSAERFTGQFYLNPNTGWTVGTYSNGITQWILKTTNAGHSWTLQGSAQNSSGPGSVFFLNESTGWSASGVSLLKTTNGGMTWNVFYSFSGLVTSVHFSNALTGCAAGESAFYKTTDGGASWQSAYGLFIGKIYSFCFINSLTGFASGSTFSPMVGKILKTTNGGINWALKASANAPIVISVSFASANVGVGVGGQFGDQLYVCKSTDAGENWFDVPVSVPYPNILTSVCFFNQSTGVAVGYDGRICRTTDAGDNWTSLNEPLFRASVNDICFTDPLNGWLACDNGTLLKTTNGGAGFTQLPVGYNDNLLWASFFNSQTGFIVGNNHISTTTNSGSYWNSTYFPGRQFTAFCSINQNIAYALLYENLGQYPVGRMIRTSNFGTSWDTISLPNTGNFRLVKFMNLNTGWIAASPYNLAIYKTTDGANSWQQQLYVSSSNQLSCISAVDDQNCWISGNYGTMYRTTNGGMNWSNITIGYTDTWYTPYVKFFNASTGIAFTNFPVARIIQTTNGGLTWVPQSDCGNSSLRAMFFVNSMTGWAAARNVFLKTTNGGEFILGLKNSGNNIPAVYSISQNYPNPFNPSTKISFSIPLLRGVDAEGGRGVSVRLLLYDVLGREITTLINEQLRPGEYSVTWDASNFASGIYFYRLLAGDYSESKKMLLIK